jgi:hypothetical protein
MIQNWLLYQSPSFSVIISNTRKQVLQFFEQKIAIRKRNKAEESFDLVKTTLKSDLFCSSNIVLYCHVTFGTDIKHCIINIYII